MLYLAIPAHNEAATIGVLLWRLRTVLAEFPREYEAVVYDDASTDSTSEILESYARVMPLTVLRGERQVGYAGAVDALVRHVARDTRYPRRDAMLLLQGDFTDSPALVPEFVRRFEGGTDVVAGERGAASLKRAPTAVRRLLRAEPWLLRFLVRAEGVRDLTASYRLVRISVLRDLLRVVGDAPVCAGDARTANADFLMRIVPLARRVEALPTEPTWEVRLRETRVVAVADGMNLLRWAWRSRGKRAVPSTAPEPSGEMPRNARPARGERDGRPELRLETRSDSGSDGAATSEYSRNMASRDGARGANRKPRGARGEGRTNGRQDAPFEKRPPAPAANPEQVVSAGTDGESDAAADKPARRKRSRGSRRERGRTPREPGTETELSASLDGESSAGRNSPPENESASDSTASATSDEPLTREVELSETLRGVVADVEAEFDGAGRTRPPRKKRRRRGGRGGRGSAAGEDSAESSGNDGGDVADGSTSEHSESAAGEIAVDGADRSIHSGNDEGSDAGDAVEGESAGDAETRVRRRGRRGRRGGSRRSRTPRGDFADGAAGENGAASAPPPFMPPDED